MSDYLAGSCGDDELTKAARSHLTLRVTDTVTVNVMEARITDENNKTGRLAASVRTCCAEEQHACIKHLVTAIAETRKVPTRDDTQTNECARNTFFQHKLCYQHCCSFSTATVAALT